MLSTISRGSLVAGDDRVGGVLGEGSLERTFWILARLRYKIRFTINSITVVVMMLNRAVRSKEHDYLRERRLGSSSAASLRRGRVQTTPPKHEALGFLSEPNISRDHDKRERIKGVEDPSLPGTWCKGHAL